MKVAPIPKVFHKHLSGGESTAPPIGVGTWCRRWGRNNNQPVGGSSLNMKGKLCASPGIPLTSVLQIGMGCLFKEYAFKIKMVQVQ